MQIKSERHFGTLMQKKYDKGSAGNINCTLKSNMIEKSK